MHPLSSAWEKFSICLPHPYLTRYFAETVSSDSNQKTLKITPAPIPFGKTPHPKLSFPLHNATLTFSTLLEGYDVPESDNTQWARSRRSPSTKITWTSTGPPTLAQLWLLVYSLFTVYHSEETIRLSIVGTQTSLIQEDLISVGLAISHPLPINSTGSSESSNELILLRSAFWQGAGSPFGRNSIWLPSAPSSSRRALDTYPILPTTQTLTTKFPSARIHTLHPIRPAKPAPGSIFYSRYIPHLDEHFSMVALDYKNPEHLNLFHTWQNDPRVAAGWNETGDIEHHTKYLRELHEDPHTFTMLAYFEETSFAYFEVYWGKEDHLGAYYPAGDWDRGRHSLVGDARFRGPHRAHAWWSSLMHYMFLDDPRTEFVVGEPKYTNARVLELDAEHGFHVEKFVDLPHKRSAFVRCSRERFFGLASVGMPFVGKGKRSLEKL